MIAALFHDIGKLRTLKPDGGYQREALLVEHEHLTLEIMQPFLRELERIDDDAAYLLRHAWTWRPKPGQSSPLSRVVTAVHSADQCSAMQDGEQRAFAEAPDWKQQARLECRGPVRRFWRRKPDSASLRLMQLAGK